MKVPKDWKVLVEVAPGSTGGWVGTLYVNAPGLTLADPHWRRTKRAARRACWRALRALIESDRP